MNKSGIIIEDIDAVNINSVSAGISSLFTKEGWSTNQEKLHGLLSIKGSNALCIRREGQVIGFVYYILYGTHAWTGYVNVLGSFRRKGYASILKQEMLSRCNNKGVKSVRLITSPGLFNLNSPFGFYVERNILN